MAVHVPSGLLLGRAAQEGLIPPGWLVPERRANIERISAMSWGEVTDRKANGWHPGFAVVLVNSVDEHNRLMGYELANKIHEYAGLGANTDLILPVGPTGQYEHAAKYLNEWGTDLSNLVTYNMDEWADEEGNVVVVGESFEQAMNRVFFGLLDQTVVSNFALRDVLPAYPDMMASRRENAEVDGRLYRRLLSHGVGQGTHIAFWEAQFAALFPNPEDWLAQAYMLGAPLNPMTIEQNAITSFRSNIFGPEPYANTIGPATFLNCDYFVGGCDGMLMQDPEEGFTMTWQAQALKMTLAWGSDDPWVPSSWLPRKLPGRLFVIGDLLDPLEAESH